MPVSTHGTAVFEAKGPLLPHTFEHRDIGPNDVHIRIAYCGVCHTDIHQAREDWGPDTTIFPLVPGHEITGNVAAVGINVTRFKPGDKAGVGFMVGACLDGACSSCSNKQEQRCDSVVYTANSVFPEDMQLTYGGYSRDIIVHEHFAFKWPDALDLCSGAPLLCAGITVYSPAKRLGINKPGTKVGVIGLGGLGHVAVRILKAFGCQVTAVSRSNAKQQEAMTVLGADSFLDAADISAMEAVHGHLDFIIDTIPVQHEADHYMQLLKADGHYVYLGLLEHQVEATGVRTDGRTVHTSAIGGVSETQEMLDFCAEHNIT